MNKIERMVSLLLTVALLLTMPGFAEVVVETIYENGEIIIDEGTVPEGQKEEEEGELHEAENPMQGEEEPVTEESEIPDENDEIESAPLPAAPEVIIAPEWEYDAEIGAITIPYVELPEMLHFEWAFDGEAAEYAVQTAPVPEGDAPEVRGEYIRTEEPRIDLPAADFAEGGWFSLYVIAVLDDGTEIEGWKYFRLEKRENASLELEPLAGQSFTIRNVKLPFSLPTSDNIISASGKIGSYNGGSGCWAFASYVYYKLFGKSFNRTVTSDFITTPGTVVKTTADNLKNLVLKAGPGAVIRVCSENYYNSKSDGSGHSMVIVSADQGGAWIYHAAGDGQILSSNTINYYTWSTWASNCTNGKFTSNGQYIKYIKYPGTENFNSAKPTGVSLDATSISRDYSQSATLKATVSPASASQGVIWSTSNANVAKISATSGGSIYVWAINPGTATITCTSTADSSKKASCTFKVNSPSTLQLTGVDYPSTYIINGNGYYLGYGTLASDVNLKSLASVIKNSSGSVVGSAYTQNLSGVKRYDIKGIDSKVPFSKITSEGSYTWTLTGTDVSGRSVTLNMKINAKKSGSRVISGAWGQYAPIKVTNIALSKSSVSLNKSKGETATLTATVSPSNASNKNVNWSTNNGAVATISGGKITPVGKGSATITCTAADGSGVKATCSVTVTEDIKVSNISLSTNSVTLNRSRGETATLTATVSPSNATNKNVSWSTNNSAVATVSGGKITPVGKGSATITCTAADGSGAKANCSVTVIEDIKVTGITLDKTSITMTTVQSEKLTATISPENASNKNLSWKSSDTDVATVADGLVKAVGIGSATISCMALDGSGRSASCNVAIMKAPKPKSISIAPKGGTINIGQTLQLVATLNPVGASTTLKWSSSSKKIATVDADGVVKGIKEGVVKITVSTANKKKATVKIKIADPTKPTKIELNRSGTVSLNLGSTLRLSATMSPSTAQSDLKWTSSNKKIAKVSDGVVIPVKAGIVTITTKTLKGGKTAKVKIKVVDPSKPTKVSLNKSSTITMKKGETLSLQATIEPTTAANSKLQWSSSNKKVVEVDSNGVLEAIKKGSATITVKTSNGKKASVKVKITN